MRRYVLIISNINIKNVYVVQVNKFMLPNSSGYEDLSSKLVEVFPQLQEGTFKVTYTDEDGDEVRLNIIFNFYFISLMQLAISNDEELSIAMTGGVNKLFIRHEKPLKCLTINAKGAAEKEWPECGGDFYLTKELHRDKPVYKSSKRKYLYSTESGAWAVSYTVGDSKPPYRSTVPAPSPALCQNWQNNKHGNSEYKPADITVTVKE